MQGEGEGGGVARRSVWLGALLLAGSTAAGPVEDPGPWTAGGRPTPAARQAVSAVSAASDEGLAPADYPVSRLQDLLVRADAGRDGGADLNRLLTRVLADFLHDVHQGRVSPRAVGFRLDVPDDRHDYLSLARDAARTGRVQPLVDEMRPAMAEYRALLQALRTYRSMGEFRHLLPSSVATLRTGDRSEHLPAVLERLRAYGDLPAAARSPEPDRLDASVTEAIRRFQRRHGLEPDGVLGRATLEDLRVPLSWRTRQLELALERLRWLPHITGGRLVAINIPMFQLWAWDPPVVGHMPSFTTGVIVGRALRTATPVMARPLEEIVFRPYWNVPRSILLGEVLPALERRSDYLDREELEIVDGEGDDGRVVAATPEALRALGEGTLRVRQRPGPRNALGLIKFVFPNEEQVYLHATPSTELFRRTRRDFSHGCVRVEDAEGLAAWLLTADGEAPRSRIRALSEGPHPARVKLRTPVQVWLFYTTAGVMPDGTVRFAQDIYRLDSRLDRALTTRKRPTLPY